MISGSDFYRIVPMNNQTAGGRTAEEVVRIGATVRRSIGPRSEFTHSLLMLLEEKGYGYAPRYLGLDESGREVLTYIEGEASHGEITWTDDQLVKVTQMLREFHDATAGSALADGREVVCHNDVAPWNTILKENTPVGFIDFDGAAPGRRADDLAYLLWTFLDLGNGAFSTDIQAARVKKLCDAYRFSNGKELINALLEQQERILLMREELVRNATTETERVFSNERIPRIRSEIAWVKKYRDTLENAVTPPKA